MQCHWAKEKKKELTLLWRLTNYKICRVSQVGTQERQWCRCSWKSDMLKTQESPSFISSPKSGKRPRSNLKVFQTGRTHFYLGKVPPCPTCWAQPLAPQSQIDQTVALSSQRDKPMAMPSHGAQMTHTITEHSYGLSEIPACDPAQSLGPSWPEL